MVVVLLRAGNTAPVREVALERYLKDWPGKSAPAEGGPAHPAVYHMLDVAAVAECLLARTGLSPARRALFTLLIALHDLGKIGEPFRRMILSRGRQHRQAWRHWRITEAWLRAPEAKRLLAERLGDSPRGYALNELIGAIAGHHGRPPDADTRGWERMRDAAGSVAAADALAALQAMLDLWPEAALEGMDSDEAKRLSWWLSGLNVVADWVGSNPLWFPPCAAGPGLRAYLDEARSRAPGALREAGLDPAPAREGWLFDFPPDAARPMQLAVQEIALPDGPMLAFIEDDTGAGKTEAGLILAQRMLTAGKGRGLYLALPTMATADAMFARGAKVLGRLFANPSLTLAHGRAALSRDFRDVQEHEISSDDVTCAPWLADNRRRALLADVGIGTIDQALLAVLPTKFATLRQWGLSSKILIVDEVHELGQPYMAGQLAQLLRFHAMQGGSAILMTATLPLDQRAALTRAFDEGTGRTTAPDDSRAYPALSIPGGAARRDFPQAVTAKGPVAVARLPETGAAVDLLTARAGQGAACVWVRNAVDDAIAAVGALRARGIEATLLHARFALSDRKRIEADMLARFGREGEERAGRVLVATQVVESSLDLDFDVMVSDLAPVAALIQRAGRLWRHMDLRPAADRPAPAPVLHVVSPDPVLVRDARWLHEVLDGGAWVYPVPELWRTADVLFRAGRIVAPGGLRDVIEAVHGPEAAEVPEPLEAAEIERIGKGHAEGNHARQNVIAIADGYRMAGGGADDREYPTRLGEETRTLLLARRDGGALRPWAEVDNHQLSEAWMMSEVSARLNRLRDAALPDQTAPDIAALVQDWPEWRQASVTVCPVGEDGRICEGLRYEADTGLLFDGSLADG